jgi:hypothetical protein
MDINYIDKAVELKTRINKLSNHIKVLESPDYTDSSCVISIDNGKSFMILTDNKQTAQEIKNKIIKDLKREINDIKDEIKKI